MCKAGLDKTVVTEYTVYIPLSEKYGTWPIIYGAALFLPPFSVLGALCMHALEWCLTGILAAGKASFANIVTWVACFSCSRRKD